MVITALNANLAERFRSLFTTRDFILHSGRDLRRFSVAGRTQAILAGVAALAVTFSACGVSQAASGSTEAAPADAAATEAGADAQFRSLFQSWQKLDVREQTVIAIPSMQPVDNMRLTSSFGVRSDPFHGAAAMHAGIDIPGPIGTPVYATADGVIGRSGRFGGYGNLVTVNHGKGIETRYGHLSKILVTGNTRVRRGQLIGLMGSTGRSTGSHLHYEVRIDGAAVNPTPFMQNANVYDQVQERPARVQLTAATGN